MGISRQPARILVCEGIDGEYLYNNHKCMAYIKRSSHIQRWQNLEIIQLSTITAQNPYVCDLLSVEKHYDKMQFLKLAHNTHRAIFTSASNLP